jgi:hypothetical protein
MLPAPSLISRSFPMKIITAVSVALALTAGVAQAAGSDEKPFTEGPVTEVSFIRVNDGKMFEYMSYLRNTWKQEHEAEKKAGLILEYHIYAASPRHPQDANLILTVTYPNYAALDRTAEFDAIAAKVEGSLKSAEKGFGDRSSVRQVLGSELVQELLPK